MADETAGADDQAQPGEGTEGDSGTDDTTKDGAGEGEADESADDGADNGGSGDKSGEQSDDAEPPVRKSAKDFIIDRKDKKIAKLEGQADAKNDQDDSKKSVRDIIREELGNALQPLTRSLSTSEDENELKTALTKYPDAKKMEKTIRRYMENEAYARVPVEFIVRGLLGAREAAKKKADAEAAASRQGGHGRRPKETKPKTAWDMTEDEFNKEVARIMSGQQ